MKYYVYVLKSLKRGKYYTGSCNNLDKRLDRHNAGKVKSIKPHRPWIRIYSEEFSNLKKARLRELQIKSYKGGNAFKKLFGK